MLLFASADDAIYSFIIHPLFKYHISGGRKFE